MPVKKKTSTKKKFDLTLILPLSVFVSSILISASIVYAAERVTRGNVMGAKITQVADGDIANTDTPTNPSADLAAAPSAIKKVSVDNDPVLGDVNAPITIIEFSDYECPFCKRHHTDTYPQLKSEYIDKGIVKLVFRDLPLSFHDPIATKEAIAANCAREQGDDETYFQFHDEVFNKTSSNGAGIAGEGLYDIASALGLNRSQLKSCIDSEKYKDEVESDLTDATNAGANGTPSFFIGKSTASGEIDGELLVGAQPFSAFKAIIDKNL
ncbi:disulfide bond formation protein DsbA [candidate division WWE3 bacterium CG10_big_fil_rev_8_21_14_0_10_32_10]|uniref:Disulfide bond formation protein DsbA n=1 Tax=candidate division WWE3 bacterium CG10_big_fil_rev_8_21_14_0_10_32_10 TaxID=1975090 RepID=A0A2H0RCU9_UNCKA|nr:MAG: disulfide bond formation protein DsbA [candidate division WWE3 bacterium CG10_big_fil_rev_8_21_14_0_10_32_10]